VNWPAVSIPTKPIDLVGIEQEQICPFCELAGGDLIPTNLIGIVDIKKEWDLL
jgi:hypothetical protein